MDLSFSVLDLPSRHDFRIAREGARLRRSVWVRLRAADGTEGWGEAAATPYYGETAETVTAALPALGKALWGAVGEDALALERADRALARIPGPNASARAALSAALHDLAGKRLGVAVWTLLGLDASAPRSSFTVGLDRPEVFREKVREAAGYPILKLKVGTEHDEELLRIVREEAPAATLRVDANTAWSVKQAIRALPLLEEYGVELVEQPVSAEDLDGLAQVRRRARLPIVADESCRVAADVPRLAGRVDGVNIKLAKCGSLREALRIVHAARAHGMSLMLGCMVESTLGIAAAVQLAPLVDWVDLDGAALLAHDPFRGPGLDADGSVRFNEATGLGVEQS